MLETKTKAILIDMDGTLANSLPVLFDFYNNFMMKFHLEGSPEEFKELILLTIPDVVTLLKQRYGLKLSSEELYDLYVESLEFYYEHKIPLYDDVHPFVEYMFARGVKLALVTSAAPELAEKFLANQRLRHRFDALVTCKNLPKGKPEPDVYLAALRQLEVEADEAIAIEDSSSGLKAAIAAGIPAIWISHNRNELPPTLSQQIFLQVHDWRECLNSLKENV